MQIGDRYYLCDVVPSCNIYEIIDIDIRTIKDNYAVGVDGKTKQAHLFTYDMLEKYVFQNRSDALEALKVFRAKDEKDE